jgi:hypothetical protein
MGPFYLFDCMFICLSVCLSVCPRGAEQLQHVSGFGGGMLDSGTQDRGFEPGRSRRIFRAKKSTACLPSKGKKAVYAMSQICGMLKEPRELRGSRNHRTN